MLNPLLSVIVPMYNVQDYLSDCVNSVFAQNLDVGLYEIILVNDGSTDNSLDKANDIARLHKNIKVVTQENKGLGGARNTGIDCATGEFILFLDSDDILKENTFKQFLEIATGNHLDILEFGAVGIDENREEKYRVINKSSIKNGVEYYNVVRYMNSACNKLYSRAFLNSNHLRFLEKIYIEDFEFNTRTFLYAKKVIATDVIGAKFLQTDNSITRNTSKEKKEKMQQDILRVIKLTAELYEKKLIENKSLEIFFKERLGFLTVTLFYQLYKNGNSYKKFRELKKLMIQDKIYYVDYPIYDKGKDIFRKVLLKHSYLYPLIFFARKIIRK